MRRPNHKICEISTRSLRKFLHGLARILHSLPASNNSRPGRSGLLLKEPFAMYLFFVPPAIAFLGIFVISLRNQFADYTNL